MHTFCGGSDLPALVEGAHVMPYVRELPIVDPLAMLACHPATLEAFFEVALKPIGGVAHMIIGSGAERSGVRDSTQLRAWVLDGCRHALQSARENL